MRLKRRSVQGILSRLTRVTVAVFCLVSLQAMAEEDVPPSMSVIISVAEQKLVVLRDGGWIKKFPVSTSKFGLGDSYGSYKTPLGKLRVCEKIGNDLSAGAVLKQRHATGEVLPVNAPGRDPIVTRIIWLDGLEPQNANARSRGIYIHGTVEEAKIGEAVSYGCIRMRSKDVVEVFDDIPLDTPVSIIAEKLPKIAKYTPPKPPVIAKVAPPKPAPATPTPAPAVVVQTKPAPEKPATPEAMPKLEPLANPGVNIVVRKPEPPINPGASLALKGSILDAGLPEGPTMLTKPTEPKDVPRFGGLAPTQSDQGGMTLQPGPASPTAPAKSESETSTDPSKPPSKIAFRSKGTSTKAKQ